MTDNKVPFTDADHLFSNISDHGIVGDKWLVDHIHPGVEGHKLIGDELADLCVEQGLIEVENADWSQRRDTAYRKYLSSIGEEYYHRGKQRLEGLQLWTQGRAKKVAKSDQVP